jgi:hypothetical protein
MLLISMFEIEGMAFWHRFERFLSRTSEPHDCNMELGAVAYHQRNIRNYTANGKDLGEAE